jgi:hypothetical protein
MVVSSAKWGFQRSESDTERPLALLAGGAEKRHFSAPNTTRPGRGAKEKMHREGTKGTKEHKG